MTDFLLDTSVLVDLSFSDLDWGSDATLAVSAVSLAELAAGPFAAVEPLERARRAQVLAEIKHLFPEPIPFGPREADAYGLVWAATAATGRKPRARLADLLIAATAVSYGYTIATRNPADFAHLRDCELFRLELRAIGG